MKTMAKAAAVAMVLGLMLAVPGFAVPTNYTVEVSVNPAAYGVVTGVNLSYGGGLTNGSNLVNDPIGAGVDLLVTASNFGTTIFSSWGGTLAASLANSNSPSTTLALEANGTLIANFDLRSSLTVAALPLAGGTTVPTGVTVVPRSKGYPIRALPAVNYEFMRWQVNGAGSPIFADPFQAETTVVPNGNPMSINAVFQSMPRLSVTAPADGSIYVETPLTNDVVAPGTSRQFPVPTNGTVLVTAMVSDPLTREFVSWFPTVGVVLDPSNSTTTIVMNKNKGPLQFTTSAKVTRQTLITVAGPNGVVAPLGTNSYIKDSVIDITASPNPGYLFLKWTTINDGPINPAIATLNPLINIQMSQDRNFKAHFTNLFTVSALAMNGPSTPVYTFNVAAGTAWSNTPPQLLIGNSTVRDRIAGYADGTGDVIPAVGPGNLVTVSKATTNSSFTWLWQRQYLLITATSPGGAISPATGVDGLWYDANTTNTISAVADPGFVLDAWKVNGVVLGHKNDNFQLVMDGPKSVDVVFIPAGDRYIPLWWKKKFGLDSSATDPNDSADGDPDNDGLSNWQEYSMMVTNKPGMGELYMDPLNADSDHDGMNDGWERNYFDIPRVLVGVDPTATFISAALINTSPYGSNDNTDADCLWSTNTGYQMSNSPLSHIMEYVGPDREGPVIQEVPWPSVFTNGAAVSWRTNVWRLSDNPADTRDGSDPLTVDTDLDGFDDGYEYSWDQWQQVHGGDNIQLIPFWGAITSTVPVWAGDRRYNPAVPRVALPAILEPDFDWLYDKNLGVPSSAFDELLEYRASVYAATSNVYPLVRRAKGFTPWCTNPFLYDTDGDALPDGWEITFGFDPWSIGDDTTANPDGDACAMAGGLFHNEVYAANGFDPNVAWDPARSPGYNNLLEFIGGAVIGAGSISNAAPAWTNGSQFAARSTNPHDVDSDHDGMHDGWELYMNCDPTGPFPLVDGLVGFDDDGLVNWQEFIGYDVLVYWRAQINAGATPDVIQAAWSNFSYSWPNKGLPTDIYNPDTDHDQLLDSTEQMHFNYGTTGTPGAGGGLNPDSVDTDLDYLSDAWERFYEATASNVNGVIILTGGVDGTSDDALLDSDGDGMYNYQEYMVGACYQFQWLFNDGTVTIGDPIGSGYDPYDFFDVSLSGNDPLSGPGAVAPYEWDPAYFADRMALFPYKPFTFMGGVPSLDPELIIFSTCNPGSVDTDNDGYDDFYELFHSLNPLRGSSDLVAYKLGIIPDPTYAMDPTYDFPFRWGERPAGPVADYDQDGQVDVEENITANLPAVLTYLHTDPSPYFVGDVSSRESYVNKFYKTGNVFGKRCYWYWDVPVLLDMAYPAAYLFSFEMNEGYDTDNDLKSDGVEVIGNTPGATDPLDDDSPVMQRALYLNGTDSAARLYGPTYHSWHSFRSFTLEAWVNPTTVEGDRVVVERAGIVQPGNPGMPGEAARVTRNFRLGVRDGIPYVAYNGYGISWVYEEATADSKYKMVPNVWRHLAASFDPVAKRLSLYVDGEVAGSKSTQEIPFNGFIAGNPDSSIPLLAYGMMVTVGAADENPLGICDGTMDDIKSGVYAWTMSPGNNYPVLTNYFAGWIDEVHLWDGTRSPNEIRALLTQKLTRGKINAINGIQTGNQMFMGDIGGSELTPKMLYAFTFDGVPPPSQSIVPDGFESAVQVPGWDAALWWETFPYHSTEYTDYRFVKWIQNMASHQPFDPPRDTHLVSMFGSNGVANIFPNSSNPYTFEYTHGLGGSWEVHPQYGPTRVLAFYGLSTPSVERDFSGVYGDLLPLGGAKGDVSIMMWNGTKPSVPNPDNKDEMPDQDGDGLSDTWEEMYGLNPFDPLDARDDPDRDGLSTLMESYTGTDPFGSFSAMADVLDFFAYTNGAAGPFRFLGEEWTDMDYMDDLWEEAYWLNTEMFDAVGPKSDPDNDGWSSLAEFQEVANLVGSSGGFLAIPTNLLQMATPLGSNPFYVNLLNERGLTNIMIWNNPQDIRFHPVPKLTFRFNYAGQRRIQANPRFVVLAYSDRGMDIPDASIRGVADRSISYPRYMGLTMDRDDIFPFPPDWYDNGTLFSTWDLFYENIGAGNAFAFEGNVREGMNWFWGFMDVSGDNVYQDDEPAGFAGPVNVRWGNVGPIDIALTDKRPMGFARFSWNDVVDAAGAGSAGGSTNAATFDPSKVDYYDVYIVDKNVSPAPTVFYRRFSPFRTWVNEGDLMAVKKLIKGFKHAGGYQWYVRAGYNNLLYDVKHGMVYVNYKNPMPAPTLIWPVGNARLRQSRDTFRWKMDDSVSYCTLTVRRQDTGQTILTYSFAPPARDIFGVYSMRMPIYMGDGKIGNGVYDYTLTVRSPVSSASTTDRFKVRIGNYPGSAHSILGKFIYPGKVTNGNFIVEAFTTPGFGGEPVGRVIVPNTSTSAAWPRNMFSFTISGLPQDTYYVRVYLDQNTKEQNYPYYVADDFESQGWYAKNFYWPMAIVVSGVQTTVLDPNQYVKVLMHDLDNDLLQDDWEFQWTGNLTTYSLGSLRGYTPALNGVLNVFECYEGAPFGLPPK